MTGNRPIPAGFRVLADAAGEDAAITICLAYGGTRLYVPYSAVGTKLEDLILRGSQVTQKRIEALKKELPNVSIESDFDKN